MKRILLVLGLVLVSSLLFADFGSGPNGGTAGNLYMKQLGELVRARVVIQNQLMSKLGPQTEEPAAAEVPGGPVHAQKRSGERDGDGVPDQDRTQAQDRLRDGTCDGSGDGPDWQPDRNGRPD